MSNRTGSQRTLTIVLDLVLVIVAAFAGFVVFDLTKSRDVKPIPASDVEFAAERLERARTMPTMASIDANWQRASMLAGYLGAKLEPTQQEARRDKSPFDDVPTWYGVITGPDSKSTVIAAWLIHRTLPAYPVAVGFDRGRAVLSIAVLGADR